MLIFICALVYCDLVIVRDVSSSKPRLLYVSNEV